VIPHCHSLHPIERTALLSPPLESGVDAVYRHAGSCGLGHTCAASLGEGWSEWPNRSYRGLTVPFILTITCFAAWGSAANLAAGLSILETSANPFVIAMGPDENATQRLNLAQSFNPVGANIGVLLGALLILPQMTRNRRRRG
jgi:predicted MFS family arabinose efflux permease